MVAIKIRMTLPITKTEIFPSSMGDILNKLFLLMLTVLLRDILNHFLQMNKWEVKKLVCGYTASE